MLLLSPSTRSSRLNGKIVPHPSTHSSPIGQLQLERVVKGKLLISSSRFTAQKPGEGKSKPQTPAASCHHKSDLVCITLWSKVTPQSIKESPLPITKESEILTYPTQSVNFTLFGNKLMVNVNNTKLMS